jgi:hypothetical protein
MVVCVYSVLVSRRDGLLYVIHHLVRRDAEYRIFRALSHVIITFS